MTRRLPAAVVFLLAFAAGRWLLGAVIPLDAGGIVRAKLDEVAHAQIDVLVVGSSRAYRQIDTGLIAAHPRVSGAYNLAVPAAYGLESLNLLRQALDEGVSPGIVIIDPAAVAGLTSETDGETRRSVAWHDPKATVDSLRFLVTAGLGVRDVLVESERHVEAMTRNLLALGHALTPDPDEVSAAAWDHGFLPLDAEALLPDPPSDDLAARRSELESLSDRAFRNYVERSLTWRRPGLLAVEEEYLRDVNAVVEAAGGRAFFVIAPSQPWTGWLATAAEQGLAEVIDLGDPRTHPELFDRALWFDRNHLNAQGAHLFTRVLVAEVAARISDRPQGAGP